MKALLLSLMMIFTAAAMEPDLDAIDTTEAGETAFYADNEELHDLLLEAAEKHPSLRALHERWLAALERVPQVTSLEDPMFMYTYFIRSMGPEYSVSLSQAFPWFGTLRARGEQALEEAEAARARMLVERNRIFTEVKMAYYELAALHQLLQVLHEENDLYVSLEALIRERYALGLQNQDDVLRLELSREQHHDIERALLQDKPAIVARLNEAVGRPFDAESDWPQTFPLPPPLPPADTLGALIRARHPEIQELDAMAEAGETGVRLARKLGYPQLVLEVMYEVARDPGSMKMDPASPAALMNYRSLASTATGAMPFDPVGTGLSVYDAFYYREPQRGRDEFAVSIGFSLPIWRKKVRAGVREAEYNLRAVEYEQQAVARRLEREARESHAMVLDARRAFQLAEERLLPHARQIVEVVRDRYATGGEDAQLADVLLAQQDTLMLRRLQIEARRDWHIAMAQLELVLGGPLPSTTVDAPPIVEAHPLPYTPDHLPGTPLPVR